MATNRLFEDFELVDINEIDDYSTLILGGGTVLPKVDSVTNEDHADLTVAMGVGASDPEFWNRPFPARDLGYYFGKYNAGGFLDDNAYVKWLLKPAEKFAGPINSWNHYLHDGDFDRLREYDFDYFGVRGPQTQELLSKYGIEAEVVGDTALVLEPSEYIEDKQKRVAVTLRHGKFQWSSDGSYREVVLDFCRTYADEYEFVFIPFFPSDISIHLEAARSIPNASFRDYCSYVDVQATIDEIAHCDLLIGDKLHANVLAAVSHTPFISLEYRPKNSDFAKSVGMSEFNIRTDTISHDILQEKWDSLMQDDSTRHSLELEVNEKRGKLTEFANRVKSGQP